MKSHAANHLRDHRLIRIEAERLVTLNDETRWLCDNILKIKKF